jgi:hypothetical protein
MYSCACSLSSHPIGLCTVITYECSQEYDKTALMLASERGNAETVRVLVELGASLEAVDKVNIHAHALANTCCIKHVCGIMRMTMIILTHAYACRCIYLNIQEGRVTLSSRQVKHAALRAFFVAFFFTSQSDHSVSFLPTCVLSPNTILFWLY